MEKGKQKNKKDVTDGESRRTRTNSKYKRYLRKGFQAGSIKKTQHPFLNV